MGNDDALVLQPLRLFANQQQALLEVVLLVVDVALLQIAFEVILEAF